MNMSEPVETTTLINKTHPIEDQTPWTIMNVCPINTGQLIIHFSDCVNTFHKLVAGMGNLAKIVAITT